MVVRRGVGTRERARGMAVYAAAHLRTETRCRGVLSSRPEYTSRGLVPRALAFSSPTERSLGWREQRSHNGQGFVKPLVIALRQITTLETFYAECGATVSVGAVSPQLRKRRNRQRVPVRPLAFTRLRASVRIMLDDTVDGQLPVTAKPGRDHGAHRRESSA